MTCGATPWTSMIARQVETFSDLIQMSKLDLTGNGQSIHRALDDATHESLQRLRIHRELPLIQPKFPQICAPRQQRLGQRLAALAVVEEQHSAPGQLQSTERVDQLRRGERLARAQRRRHAEATQRGGRLRATTDGGHVAQRADQLRVTSELL